MTPITSWSLKLYQYFSQWVGLANSFVGLFPWVDERGVEDMRSWESTCTGHQLGLPVHCSVWSEKVVNLSFSLTLSSLHDPPGLLGSNTGTANTRLRSGGGEGTRGWRNLTNQDLLCWNCFAFSLRQTLCRFFMFVQSHYFENKIHLHYLWKAIQEDYFLARLTISPTGCPKKVYNRMLLEPQYTG